MALSIFISYSNRDLPVAQAIWSTLAADGHVVEFAEVTLHAGAKITVEVEQKIKACDIFVVLWSRNAKESDWVSQEIGIAQGAGKEILPVILEPGLQPPGFIRDRKFLPAYEGFEEALAHLRQVTAHHAEEKKKSGLALIGLGALILWAISSK